MNSSSEFAVRQPMNKVLQTATKPSLHVDGKLSSAQSSWRKGLYAFIDWVYFENITLIHPERFPKSGPVLYLGLHRNGAVDGFVYHRVLNGPVFMISTQLRKNWVARFFFDGIAITRTKDEGDKNQNAEALRKCLGHLHAGGELFIFPEGTSSLGPQHLPFKNGALWLMLDYLDSHGPPLQVVPVGIHYQCPRAFRSKVEVVLGSPIATDLPAAAGRMERLKIMKQRVQTALEEVGINVVSDEYQQRIQCFGSLATLGTRRSYFKSLKAMERTEPGKIVEEWRRLEPDLREASLWRHQGVPLFPDRPLVIYLLALLVIGPFVLTAMVFNLPPLAVGWVAARKFSDGDNVISLWKILAGLSAFVLWLFTVVTPLLIWGKFWWLAIYIICTWLGLKFYYRFKKLAVAVHNARLQPALQPVMTTFHQTILRSLPNENV
jgi:1-acyl-sn-glycerol-3-phosphate acyltransferase